MFCTLSRHFAILAVAGVLAISTVPLNRSIAQEASNPTGNKCDSNKVKGFERRPTATHQVTANFFVSPAVGTSGSEIKNYVEYLLVLGKFASRQLFKASSGRCSFGASTDTNLNVIFELFSIGENVHDECSLTRCVHALSDVIESSAVNQTDFSRTIDELVMQIRRSDSVDFRYPFLAARNALQEAYRHIYPAETRERILVDISSEDLMNIRFDEFSAWLKVQQAALRNAQHRDEQSVAGPARFPQDVPSGSAQPLEVEELSIDHHGWGHQAIVLINHAYEHEGIDGIENPTIRAICHSNSNGARLGAEPWREMADRLACHREFIGRDKWLCLYSKKEPRATSAEMTRYAYSLAELLKSDKRIHPGLRVIVAKFKEQ